jgi:hypothetical protein
VSDTTVANLSRQAGLIGPPLSEARKAALRGTIEANSLMAKWKRSRQALALMTDTERLRKQLWQPVRVYGFGRGHDGEPVYVEHEIGEPDAKSKQALAITIGVLTDKALQLLRYDRDDDSTSTVKASILQLVDRLAEDEQRAGGPAEEEESAG